jgi:hypothetical protein
MPLPICLYPYASLPICLSTHMPLYPYASLPICLYPYASPDIGAGRKRASWVIRRKPEMIAAVRGGLLSIDEACSRYMLTVDELLSWQSSLDQHGLAGLHTTRIQQYRM